MEPAPQYVFVWVVMYEVFQDTREIVGIYTTQEAAQRAAAKLDQILTAPDLKHIRHSVTKYILLA